MYNNEVIIVIADLSAVISFVKIIVIVSRHDTFLSLQTLDGEALRTDPHDERVH